MWRIYRNSHKPYHKYQLPTKQPWRKHKNGQKCKGSVQRIKHVALYTQPNFKSHNAILILDSETIDLIHLLIYTLCSGGITIKLQHSTLKEKGKNLQRLGLKHYLSSVSNVAWPWGNSRHVQLIKTSLWMMNQERPLDQISWKNEEGSRGDVTVTVQDFPVSSDMLMQQKNSSFPRLLALWSCPNFYQRFRVFPLKASTRQGWTEQHSPQIELKTQMAKKKKKEAACNGQQLGLICPSKNK